MDSEKRTLLNGGKRKPPRKVVEIHDDDYGTVATYRRASIQSVGTVMGAEISDDNGYTRSPWLLIRLPNGDLIFGCFPQDECYTLLEKDASF